MASEKVDVKKNLRGKRIRLRAGGEGVVITRIRGTRWLVQSPDLPESCRRGDGSRRIVLERRQFVVLPDKEPPVIVRAARSPIERMIDEACGVPRRASR